MTILLQTCCAVVLAWSVVLQRYFLGSRFWHNQYSVYKVIIVSMCFHVLCTYIVVFEE